ncbi:P-loop NTPase [Halomicrobium salinisoli]|uniref:P-loop NTPase n=1 Tax=Halomicrobium salinisoli TaxID=2878391 RepID=UPI001CEFD724|nr:P-loop NTPase [Halomicrobium salinisoli]
MTERLLERLATVEDPDLGADVVSLGLVGDVETAATTARVPLALGAPYSPAETDLLADVRDRVEEAGYDADVVIDVDDATPAGDGTPAVIGLCSGKGGVGTSTVAVNLAAAMARRGARVGLFDADVYGPTVAHELGVDDGTADREPVTPVDSCDLELFGVGFLADGDGPVAGRPTEAAERIADAWAVLDWADRDYVIVDLPSGSGATWEAALDRLPLVGTVVVTTPQSVAVAGAREAVAQCRDRDLPVLGVVENKRTFVCPECNAVHDRVDTRDGELLADDLDAPLLVRLPLDPTVREHAGAPIALAADGGITTGKFRQLARTVMDRVGRLRRRSHAERADGSKIDAA